MTYKTAAVVVAALVCYVIGTGLVDNAKGETQCIKRRLSVLRAEERYRRYGPTHDIATDLGVLARWTPPPTPGIVPPQVVGVPLPASLVENIYVCPERGAYSAVRNSDGGISIICSKHHTGEEDGLGVSGGLP